MTGTTARRRTARGPFTPNVKVWLEVGGSYAFGLGICEILEAVDRAGAIKQAAADLGKSYRYVWGRIKAAERALGEPLVRTQVGGKDPQRSALTPAARRYAAAFRALRARPAGRAGDSPAAPGAA